MKHKTSKVLSVLLAVLTLISVLAVETISVSAAGEVKSKLDSFISRFPSGSRWTGSFADGIECYGFAKMAVNEIFGELDDDYRTWKYDGSSKNNSMDVIGYATNFSESNVKSLLNKAKCGDILQFDAPSQHSMIVYSVESNAVSVYDCNWDNNCGISLRRSSFNAWSGIKSNRLTLLRSSNYNDIDASIPYKCSCSTAYSGDYTCINATLIRGGHRNEYSVIGNIPLGAAVKVTKSDGTWAHVTYNNISGYALMANLRKTALPGYYVDAWASTNGKGYSYDRSPIANPVNAGNSYYIWYKIANGKSGSIYQGSNYSVKISVIYPDGSQMLSQTYKDNGTNCVSFKPDVKGTYKVLIQGNGDITFNDTKEITVDCDGEVYWYNPYVNFYMSTKESDELEACLSGTYPSDIKYELSYDKDIISVEEIGDLKFRVKALKIGSTKLNITMLDRKRNYISNANCNITVAPTKAYIIRYDANGGTNAPDAHITDADGRFAFTEDIPVRDGCTFLGWAYSPDAIRPNFHDYQRMYTAYEDTVFYAVWGVGDLVISNIVPVDDSFLSGDIANFYVTLRNIGEYQSNGEITVSFFIDGIPVETVKSDKRISASDSINIATTKGWKALAGTHTVTAVVNYGKSLPEDNYSNNSLRQKISVTN